MLLGMDACNTSLTLKPYLLVMKSQNLVYDNILCRGSVVTWTILARNKTRTQPAPLCRLDYPNIDRNQSQ